MQNLRGRKLILASASPRRRELLGYTGLTFEVLPTDVDESEKGVETPHDYVKRLALDKAKHVALLHPKAVVLGADTVVALHEEEQWSLLGKPSSREDAIEMLLRLQGKEHSVVTGFSVTCAENSFEYDEAVETKVMFRELSRFEIESYVDTGDPMDKAGAYGIQGQAEMFIPSITGSYTNVVGLPMSALLDVLISCGLWQAGDMLAAQGA